jgi:hypothetical protein
MVISGIIFFFLGGGHGGKCPRYNFLRDKGIILPPPPDNPTVQIARFINEFLWVLFNNIGT